MRVQNVMHHDQTDFKFQYQTVKPHMFMNFKTSNPNNLCCVGHISIAFLLNLKSPYPQPNLQMI